MDAPTAAYSPIPSSLHSVLDSLPTDKSSLLSYGLVLSACAILYSTTKAVSKLPEGNPRHTLELSNSRRIREYMSNSIGLLKALETQFAGKPYRLFCDVGEVTVLPPTEIDSIRSDKRFDFSMSSSDVRMRSLSPAVVFH